MLGKEPQLPGRAPTLALKPRSRQAGLGATDLGDLCAARLDFIGDSMQKRRARGPAGGAKGPERLFRGPRRPIDKVRRADRKRMACALCRIRQHCLFGASPRACNQMLAMGGKGHGKSFRSEGRYDRDQRPDAGFSWLTDFFPDMPVFFF